jgi:hypothetical protein
MLEKVYYGEYGEYGPYTPQEDLLPDAGEVHRDFRSRMPMSVEEYVEAYNKKVAEFNAKYTRKPRRKLPLIQPSWVYKMEKYNLVPTDPDRRRMIAEIIKAPLWLFGLVTVEEVILKQRQITAPSPVKKHTIDLLPYEENVRTFWRFHYTSNAQNELYAITKTISELELYEQQVRGNLQKHIRELLYSYYALAGNITRDQNNYLQAFTYTNNAVRVAKSLQQDAINETQRKEIHRLVATAQYERGYIRLGWGLYGKQDARGSFHLDQAHIQAAIADFEEASKYASPSLKGSVLQELSRAQGFRRRRGMDSTLAQKTVEAAGNWIGIVSTKDDPYVQIVQDGRLGGLTEGAHHLGRAVTFNAVGRPDMAKQALDDLEELTTGRIPRDQIRNNTWVDIVWAQAALGLKDFDMATVKATNALLACQDINSVVNIAIIQNMYAQLLQTSYKEKQEVKNLGKLLAAQK